jgi:hypothetical protein
VDTAEPLTQRSLAIFHAVLRTRVDVQLHLDTVASGNTGSFADAGKSKTDTHRNGVEVGLDPG